MKQKYNSEFKIIDTKNKAYTLGLIYSDGCITWNERQSYQCKIKIKDLDVLEKIHKEFPFFCAPKITSSCYYIYCYSKELVSDLMEHGLVPSKSIKNVHLLKNPGILCYPGDFLRGVFDGDGNVYVSPANNKKLTIYCNCKSFIDYLCDIYTQHQIKYSLVHRIRTSNPLGIYELKVGSQPNVKKLVNLMKPINSIYMDRKWTSINNFVWKDLKAIKSAATKARYKKQTGPTQ